MFEAQHKFHAWLCSFWIATKYVKITVRIYQNQCNVLSFDYILNTFCFIPFAKEEVECFIQSLLIITNMNYFHLFAIIIGCINLGNPRVILFISHSVTFFIFVNSIIHRSTVKHKQIAGTKKKEE